MRKSIKRNLAYDDQKDLYYVTMHYGICLLYTSDAADEL